MTLGRGGTESSTHPRSCFSFLIVHPVLFLLSHTDYRCYLYLYRLVSVTFFQPDPFVLTPLTTETENNRLYHLSLPLNVRNISEDMHSQPFTKWGLLLSFAEFWNHRSGRGMRWWLRRGRAVSRWRQEKCLVYRGVGVSRKHGRTFALGEPWWLAHLLSNTYSRATNNLAPIHLVELSLLEFETHLPLLFANPMKAGLSEAFDLYCCCAPKSIASFKRL